MNPHGLINHGSMCEKFLEIYGADPVLYRAPGRINLIGEHTDYNDGFVMPMNTALFTWLAIRPRPDRKVRVHSVLFGESAEIRLDGIGTRGQGGWIEYVRGVSHILMSEGFELKGAEILIDGELPLGGGLSSSASLECVIASAMLGNAGLAANPMQVAQMCQRAEHEFAGVPCGIMDQAVIAACPRGHAIKMDCRTLEFDTIALPEELCILVVDSGVKHQLSDGGYSQRREECSQAVTVLTAHEPSMTSLRDASVEIIERLAREMGEAPYRRARHVVSEIQRVHQAEQAIARSDFEALGGIINASHASLRDDFMVSCAELDRLTEIAGACPGVYGSRMVGGGFGGCTISLIDQSRRQQVTRHIVDEYRDYSGRTPWHHIARPAAPAGRTPEQV